jgi:hypothetical protein
VQVLDGKATVTLGSQHVTAGKDRDVIVSPAGKLKAQDFSSKAAQSESLVRWSRLRSEYEAQANYETAQTLAANNGYYGSGYGCGPAWYGPGWYWDAGFGFWSFLPGDGFLYSPFGWGFYSPAFLYGYGYHPGFYGRPAFGGGGFRGGFAGGGFHGGGGGRR